MKYVIARDLNDNLIVLEVSNDGTGGYQIDKIFAGPERFHRVRKGHHFASNNIVSSEKRAIITLFTRI